MTRVYGRAPQIPAWDRMASLSLQPLGFSVLVSAKGPAGCFGMKHTTELTPASHDPSHLKPQFANTEVSDFFSFFDRLILRSNSIWQ